MATERDARRSTSALLYDESEDEKRAVYDQERVIRYSDLGENDEHGSCCSRIKSRHGLLIK